MFIALGISLLIIALAVFRLMKYHSKTKTYYRVVGLVIDNKVEEIAAEMPGVYNTYYYPVIEFTDKQGIEQTYTSSLDNPDRPLYKTGDTVKLLVNHEDASRFIFHDVIDGYVIPILWVVIGIAVAVGAFVLSKD